MLNLDMLENLVGSEYFSGDVQISASIRENVAANTITTVTANVIVSVGFNATFNTVTSVNDAEAYNTITGLN